MNENDITEYKRVLNSILEDTIKLTNLSNSMLQLAQATYDTNKLKLEIINFEKLVVQSQEEIKKQNKFSQISFVNQINQNDQHVQGNEQLLSIAIRNIIENALKFSNNGNCIEVKLSSGDKFVHLEVIDTGIGINATDMEHIFEPFYRAGNVRNITGHGIGLSLTEKIVHLHNGSISLKSVVEKGTTAAISLPVVHTI